MHARTKGRIAGLALLAAATLAANATPSLPAAAASTEGARIAMRVTVEWDQTAQAVAQKHFSGFLAHTLDTGTAGETAASVKIERVSAAGIRELTWIVPLSRDGAVILGTPVDATRPSEVIRFTAAEVRDWSLTGADGRLYGNFAARQRLAALSPAEAHRIRNHLTTNPVPPGW